MSIGIDFILRAQTSAFNSGLATANNSIKNLKRNLSESGGRKLEHIFGIAGVIEGFKLAIDRAQELRKGFEEMGRSVPETIASVARLGDSLEAVGNGLKDLGVTVIGTYTRAGELFGSIINQVRFGAAAESIEKMSEATGRAADKQEARRNKAFAKNEEKNTPEALAALDKQITDARHKASETLQSDQVKLNHLYMEEIKLRDKANKQEKMLNEGTLMGGPAKLKETQLAIAQKMAESAAAQRAFDEKKLSTDLEVKNAERANREAKEKLLDSKRDRFLPTLEELAMTQGVGTETAQGMAVMKARQLFTDERDARYAAQRGDLAGALSLQDKADKLRAGLGGFAKSDEVNKEKATVDAVDKTTDQLIIANAHLASLTKVTP